MLYEAYIVIIEAIAALLTNLLLLRFWMQAIRVRPPMSIAEFIYQLTDWLVKPLRRVIPGVGGYDWASLVGAFLIVAVFILAQFGLWPILSAESVLLFALHALLVWAIYGLILLLVLEFIFSWVNPHAPIAPFIQALNYPLLRPIRRVVPLIGNIDFSIFIAFLLLKLLLIVVSHI